MADVLALTQAAFQTEVLDSAEPVLVDFWADWCGPCRMLGPVIDELSHDYAGKIKVAKLNVDDEGALAAQFGVMSIPTVILFVQGKETERFVGVRPKSAFSEVLDNYIKNS